MLGAWRKRVWWTAIIGLTGASYGACAWLWAAPYRPAPQPASEPISTPPAALAAVVNEPAEPVTAPSSVPAAPAPVSAKPARTPALERTRNFLIVGLDRRPDGSGPALADTLLLVVLDEQSDHVGLVSVPRDLYVTIPDGPTDRINTVYQVAKRSRRDPLALLSRVVEDTLKLPIEHALALDLGVFERAVDAVGGVEVDVPCAIADNFIDAREPSGRRPLDLDAGTHQLDGVTAAMYARSRHGRSDFHRARRQQAVLLGVQRALSGLGVVKLPDLLAAFEASIETDLRRIELLALARRALSLEPSKLHGLVIGHGLVEGLRTPEGKSVLLPKYEAIDAALGKLFSAPSPGVRPAQAACEPKHAALRPS